LFLNNNNAFGFWRDWTLLSFVFFALLCSLSLVGAKVNGLLAARLAAKLSRDFHTADAIRDELQDLGVVMHDGAKQWRGDGVDAFSGGGGPNGESSGRSFSAARGSGADRGRRQDGSQDPQGYAYSRAGLQACDGGAEVDEVKVHELIDVRGQYKMTGRFAEADGVRDQLLAMGVRGGEKRARRCVDGSLC
jgi:hypothetical protein